MGLLIPSFSDVMEVSRSRGADSDAPHLWKKLVGAWPMNEPGGNIAYDVSGWRQHGNLTNMDPATDRMIGPYGRYLDFDGSDDEISWTVGSRIPIGAAYRTVSAWVKTTDTQAAIVSWGNNVGYGEEWFTTVENNQIGVRVSNGNRLWTANGSNNGAWHHFVWINPGTSTNDLLAYMDGKPLVVASTLARDIATITGFGKMCARPTDPAYHAAASVFCVSIYSSVLLLAEIQQEYADPWAMYRPRVKVYPTATAPIITEDTFINLKPFETDELIGTASATEGSAPYTYEIISETLRS